MQDYKEIIKDTIKEALEETNKQSNKLIEKLIKMLIIQCVVLCTAFALILISISGFYFIGYTNYPKEESEYVGYDQELDKENTLQTTKATKSP